MGADLDVTARSPRLAERMAAFLQQHVPTVQERSGLPTKERLFWIEADGLNIKLHKISAYQDLRREVGFSLMHFAAIKVGRRKRHFPKIEPEIPPFIEPVPYVLYDSFEPWPVLAPCHQSAASKEAAWCFVDSHGVPYGKAAYSVLRVSLPFFHGKDPKDVQRLIRIAGIQSGKPEWKPLLKIIEDEVLGPVRSTMSYLASLWV